MSVPYEGYVVYSYNRNGLCALGFMDDHYPAQSAFSLLNKVLDEYQKNFGDSWRTVQKDNTQLWPYLKEALTKFQDPAEADRLLKVQRELDETKLILNKTIDSVLARGEKLDSLVEKSSDLSAASRVHTVFCATIMHCECIYIIPAQVHKPVYLPLSVYACLYFYLYSIMHVECTSLESFK